MPAVLRRLRSASCSSPATPPKLLRRIPSNSSSPPATPLKRRRLTLTIGDAVSSCKPVQEFSKAAPTQEAMQSGNQATWTALDIAHNTPSRADGMSEKAERTQRMLVCDDARTMVRALFASGSVGAVDLDEAHLGIQVSACYFVQVFYMFASLSHQSPHVVAEAAVSVALSVNGAVLHRSMEDALESYKELRAERNEQGEGSQLFLGKSSPPVLDVEQRLHEYLAKVQCISADSFELPSKEFNGIIDRLLLKLPDSQAFQASPAIVTDVVLRAKLAQTARCFLADGMMGVGPLLLLPHTMACGALVLAARHVLRQAGAEMSSEELFGMVEDAVASSLGGRIARDEIRQAVEECVAVPRLWKETCCDATSVTPSC